MSRDQLLGYLWSESPAGAARHSLEQLLHVLRRVLGESVFIGTDPLRLNPEVVTSDVVEFERALADGELVEAVRLYRGPFLGGFYLDDAPEFERWVASERARLSARYAGALERLASEASVADDHAAATRWWRQLAETDPLSNRSAMGLIRGLVASGDRVAALQYARQYESIVRRDLNSAPDPAVTAYVAQLRTGAESSMPSTEWTAPLERLSPPPPSPSHVVATADRPGAPTLLRRLWRPLIGFAAIAAAVMAGTWVARRMSERPPPLALDPNRVLVVPFRVTSADSTLLYLREGMVDLIAARLTGEGGARAVDPRTALSAWRRTSAADGGDVPEGTLLRLARGLGAGQLLLGEVVVTRPGQMLLSGRVVSSRDGSAGPQASVTGRTEPTDSLLAVIDQFGSTLLALRAGEDQRRLASLTSTSPQALDAFLRGRAESRLGHGAATLKYFARALDYDSTFALAAVELALASGWLLRWGASQGTDSIRRTRGIQFGGGALSTLSDLDQWDRAMELAWRGRDKLTRADRALLLALRGDHHPGPSYAREMLAHWEQAVRAAPDRPEAHYSLGSMLLTQGLVLGLADSRARAAAGFRHALQLDSAFLPPITGLVEIAALERDTATLRRLQTLYLAQDSLGDEADYVRWLVAAAMHDETALRRIRARFSSLDLGTLRRIWRTSQMDGIALDDAERADSAILARTNESQQRRIALHDAASLALNRGRPDHAQRLMGLKRELDPSSQVQRGRALRYALMWDGDSLAGASAVRAFQLSLSQSASASTAAPDLDPPWYNIFSLALWRLWHGDTTGAMGAMQQLRRERQKPQAPADLLDAQVRLLDALLAGTLKRPDAAATLARLDSTALLGCCTLPQFINLVSARLHERAGNLAAALAAVRRGRWLFPPEYLSTYLREEGRLAALTGDTAGAIAAYRHYLTLRSSPEPSLQPPVDSVRVQLARLERRRS